MIRKRWLSTARGTDGFALTTGRLGDVFPTMFRNVRTSRPASSSEKAAVVSSMESSLSAQRKRKTSVRSCKHSRFQRDAEGDIRLRCISDPFVGISLEVSFGRDTLRENNTVGWKNSPPTVRVSIAPDFRRSPETPFASSRTRDEDVARTIPKERERGVGSQSPRRERVSVDTCGILERRWSGRREIYSR